jgi:hypothetical protein
MKAAANDGERTREMKAGANDGERTCSDHLNCALAG